MTKKIEIKRMVIAALTRNRKSLDVLKGNDNPQVIAIYREIKGQVTALEAIHEALNGDTIALGILAK